MVETIRISVEEAVIEVEDRIEVKIKRNTVPTIFRLKLWNRGMCGAKTSIPKSNKELSPDHNLLSAIIDPPE